MSGIPSYKAHTKDISSHLAGFRAAQPDLMKAFGEMSAAATRDGVLDAKTKELIALALAVAAHCDACIGFHVKALIKLGVTREQLMETLAICVYMGGGPALMYAAEAIRAYEEFEGA